MIDAAEALRLKTAQLTDEEKQTADAIVAEIKELVAKKMERRGIDYVRKVDSLNVIAEVNQRLKSARWEPHMEIIFEKHRFNAAQVVCVGFKMMLSPTDEAYRAAEQLTLS